MCGIAGIIGNIENRKKLVSDMIGLLKHRGPDDYGIYDDGDVTLGHHRLSILDLSKRAHQPMLDLSGRFVLSFNGEIYNYLELANELKLDLPDRIKFGDTAVLLRVLHQYGLKTLNKLNGMWAFAFWDKKRKELVLCRDRFGVKPLYYGRYKDCVVFASEMKAILCLPGFKTALSRGAVVNFLTQRMMDYSENTFFENIFQLEPAHYIRIGHNGSKPKIQKTQYWLFPQELGVEEKLSYKDKVDIFKTLFEDAVKIRTRSDVKIATMLSGGLDSSSITSTLAEFSRTPLNAYSVVFPDSPFDESCFAKKAVEKYPHVAIQWLTPKADEFIKDLPTFLWHLEEPPADGSMYAHFKMMEEIGEDNIKVVLTGQGADELLSGYLHTFLPAYIADCIKSSKMMRKEFNRLYKIPLSRIAFTMLPVSWKNRIKKLQFMKETFRLFGKKYYDLVHPRYAEYGNQRVLNQYLISSFKAWSLPSFLHYDDRNSMAHSIETRAPFLDYRIVEFVFKCGNDIKCKDYSKQILRDSLNGRLCSDVLYRIDKQGFYAPQKSWETNIGMDKKFLDFYQELFDITSPEIPFALMYRFKLLGKFSEVFNLY